MLWECLLRLVLPWPAIAKCRLLLCPRAPPPAAASLLTPRHWQTKAFDQDISGLALHPTGYLLLSGFADKLCLMTVLSGQQWA